MTVFSTVSHVPQLVAAQQLVPQELAPQGLQLEAQGAEQHELVLLPKQPACADAVIRTAAASDKTYRMSLELLLESQRFIKNKTTLRGTLPETQVSNC